MAVLLARGEIALAGGETGRRRAGAHQSRQSSAGFRSGQAGRRADHHARPAHLRLEGAFGAGVRRGPAEEARTLYEDMSPPPTPKGEALPDAIPALREAGSGRPTKKERRLTDRLLGED